MYPVHALCALQARWRLSVHARNICYKYVNMGVNSAFPELTNTMACVKNGLGASGVLGKGKVVKTLKFKIF